ncbi:MAG TPA: hypothetical protein VF794_14375 [Archangium sp.]|jgi:hypothetical protein|uniref:hypothetical protein n=1 Tax=Archangium sp. TaxID=1872627 RepID=UPI002ED7841D
MTRTKLILAGLIAGAMALGTACKSDKAAEKAPTDQTSRPQTTDPNQGGTSSGTTTPGGTGGSGYEEEDSRFDESQELGGNKFPSDDTVPEP